MILVNKSEYFIINDWYTNYYLLFTYFVLPKNRILFKPETY